MRPSRRTFLLAAAGTAVPGCGSLTGGSGRTPLRLATGEKDGAYFTLGHDFATQLRRHGLHVAVVETNASQQNLDMLADPRPDRRADLAFVLSDSAHARRDGSMVTALARMYLNYVHLIVLEGSGIDRIEELAGRTVSTGAHASGTALTAGRVLRSTGFTTPPLTREMRLAPSLRALSSGNIDAFFWSGGVPTPAIHEFVKTETRARIRLLPLDAAARRLARTFGGVYEDASIPAGSYGVGEPVATIGTASYLVCRAGLPDSDAFTVTKTLFEHPEELKPPDSPGGTFNERYAIGTGSVPLHEGAKSYYRSVYD
jgi:hypothetical protein